MSSYIDFWACKNETPILLTYGSRSSELYQFFYDSVPYAQTKKLTKEDINDYINDVKIAIDNYKSSIDEAEEKQEFLQGCNLSAEDLSKQFFDIQSEIHYDKEQIEITKFIGNFLQILLDIIEDDSAEVYVGIDAQTPYYTRSDTDDFRIDNTVVDSVAKLND